MFFNRAYSADELRKHCGSPQQLGKITSYELQDGREKGVRCLDFRTGSGLNFTVVASRGMDIAGAEYKGRNLSWLSPTTIVAPEYYEPEGWSWIRGFFGGLLTTCGLLNVGIPDNFRNEPVGAHGRFSYLPASNVSYDYLWVGDDLHLLARGEVREVRPPYYNYVLRRRIQAVAGEKSFRIHDTVENQAFEKVPHQILYHFNLGFPLVSKPSLFHVPARVITPRDQNAMEGKEHYNICADPVHGYHERVFYHDCAMCTDSRVWAAIVNPELDNGIGVYVKYDPTNLPILTQWKMMSEGMYVMGIEPCNTFGIGITRQQGLGMLKFLEPGETREYQLEIGILDGPDEISAFEREISVVAPAQPEFASILV